MAAPLKDGLDYFNCDCIFEDKIELVIAEFGMKGLGILIKLWQKIYSSNGYYCQWDDDVALMFANKISTVNNVVGVNAVSEFISACLRRGVFDRGMFERYNILTSTGIQKRYFEATKRRQQQNIKYEYLLIDAPINAVNVNNNLVNVNNNLKNADNNSQSKVKESKVKKSTVKDTIREVHSQSKHEVIENSSVQESKKVSVQLLLNDKTLFDIFDEDITHWQKLYPAVNVAQELNSMVAWCEANPKKRKTRAGIKRFIVSWLAKKQDRGGGYLSVGTTVPEFKPSRT